MQKILFYTLPIFTTSKTNFKQHLSELGVTAGMHLAVHSRMISFGRLLGGAAIVWEALIEAVGPSGTIVLPAYTLNLTGEDVYDPKTTPTHAMGQLPEYARTNTSAQRTLCPLHGHLVWGAWTDKILAADPNCSMGPGSAFEAMDKVGFRLLLLGCNFQEGATYVHHVEAIKGVSYRHWLNLPRNIKIGGQVEHVSCRYYGRLEKSMLETDLTAVERRTSEIGFSTQVAYHGRKSCLVTLKHLNECVFKMIDEDPYALMKQTKTK